MADPESSSSSSSVESVISSNDLLTEILVRLPILSLILFKSVSKRWNSLIIDYANNLSLRRKLDPPSGLFLTKNLYKCDFFPLDNRIPVTNFTFGGPEVQQLHKSYNGDVRIWDSCNGLLLYGTYHGKFYVCNPSITNNMFKLLPQPHNVNLDSYNGGLSLAFDPIKSPHYKVIHAEIVERGFDDMRDRWAQIHTFSSETGNWSLCEHHFPEPNYNFYGHVGVYWNDAIYWSYCGDTIFKLDIMNEEHPVLTPLTVCKKPHDFNSLFKSRGCLLLVGYDEGGSEHTIYEKGSVHSEWSVKYIVNLRDIIYPESLSDYDKIICIVLGEKDEDSFLVWQLGTKVVQHKIYPKNFVSKSLSTISDLGPNDNLLRCFQFIPSFANV